MPSWKDALSRTRNVFKKSVGRVFSRREKDPETLEELEQVLLQADVAPRLVMELVEALGKHRGDAEERKQLLRDLLLEQLGEDDIWSWNGREKPLCVLMIGINGSGKTTTTAKLGKMAMGHGLQPMFGAADTFRAAGSSQLKRWADKIGCAAVTGQQGSDAASVAYDALDAAIARDVDAVFIDTAGRMHNRGPLMEELKKMRRAIEKRLPGAPHETWVVLDASIGQNAIQQAKVFHEAVPLTGIVLTKLDGSAKAGFMFSVKQQLQVPIRFVGLGEGEDDLVPFSARDFVNGLLDIEDEQLV